MAQYGRDYTSGRYTRRSPGSAGNPWDRWGGGQDRWTGGGREYGWGGTQGRGGYGGFDESRGAYGAGRAGSENWSPGWGGWNQWRGGGGGGYGGTRPDRDRFWDRGGIDRGYYDREMHGRGGYNRAYDEDFGDRIRRGWNRFRAEARDWMGRGYDRGW